MTDICYVTNNGAYEVSHPDKGMTRLTLNENGSSWIEVFSLHPKYLLSSEKFEKLWSLHPEEKGKIKIMGKELETPRWQQSYLKGYWFSGMNHEAIPLPEEFKPYLDIANKFVANKNYSLWKGCKKEVIFNQVLVNWYEDGRMYIGPHSDNEKDLLLGPNKETLIWSLTLQSTDDGINRIFRLKPKKKTRKSSNDRLDVKMTNGMVILMGGTCQQTHKHQVPKVGSKRYKECPRRINLTFRIFKE